MGSFSVFHFVVLFFSLVLGLAITFLPIWVKPSGPNRFGPSAVPRSFPDATSVCLHKYFGFQGRGTRSEFWWFILAACLIWIALGAVRQIIPFFGMIAGVVVNLALFFPLLAAAVRRLHDLNRSGWWILMGLLSFVTLVVLLAWPSQKDETAEVF